MIIRLLYKIGSAIFHVIDEGTKLLVGFHLSFLLQSLKLK